MITAITTFQLPEAITRDEALRIVLSTAIEPWLLLAALSKAL